MNSYPGKNNTQPWEKPYCSNTPEAKTTESFNPVLVLDHNLTYNISDKSKHVLFSVDFVKILKNIGKITAQKVKFSVMDFFGKCDQICSFLPFPFFVLCKDIWGYVRIFTVIPATSS